MKRFLRYVVHRHADAQSDCNKPLVGFNYRPNSLLPTLSKLLERVVHMRVFNFLTLTNQLQPNQFGFRKNHSIIDAVTKFVEDTYSAIENNEYTIGVFIYRRPSILLITRFYRGNYIILEFVVYLFNFLKATCLTESSMYT